jgi:predicted  nucleic acid-binding Zn-ribbon protein
MVVRNPSRWRLDRRIDLSVLLQIMTLASLIVGSWVNIQRQLDQLQRDVTVVLESQKANAIKLDAVSAQVLAHEYRLQAVEKRFGQIKRPTF